MLSIVALVQRSTAIHERDTAQARLLDSEALGQYATDPEVSVILAARAARIRPDAQSAYALRDALLHSRIRYRIPLAAPSRRRRAVEPGRLAAAGDQPAALDADLRRRVDATAAHPAGADRGGDHPLGRRRATG